MKDLVINRFRFPLLALSLLLMMAAIWAGELRLGWRWPIIITALPISHGPLMVSGFLGTLIGLERAVALQVRWAYLGPLATALGGITLLFDIANYLGAVLILVGSFVLVIDFVYILRRHMAAYTITMALGALVWFLGNLLWVAGRPIFQIVLWWAGFMILTIAGERLELGRLLSHPRIVQRIFNFIVAVFLIGLVILLELPETGIPITGLAMIALAAWLLVFDIARRTVRRPGLPRYTAICLLTGYFWLGVSGFLILGYGQQTAGMLYDAYLHAVFLGFVFSMLFAHAPIIFPAVLGYPVAFHPGFYVFLITLQVSLLARIGADLMGNWQMRLWAGVLNGIALILFIVVMMIMVLGGLLRERQSGAKG